MRVLLAVDGTEASARAASFVETLLDEDRREVTTLAVAATFEVPAADLAPLTPEGWTSRGAVVAAVADQRAKVERQRSVRAAETQAPEGAELEVRAGDPAETILAAADELDAELIVVGAHDRGTLERLLVGSVSQKVARRSSRPVLVVH